MNHRRQRENQVVDALRAAGCPRRPPSWRTSTRASANPLLKLAHEGVVAHLVKLEREGRVRRPRGCVAYHGPMNQVVDFINVNRNRYIEELKQYLAIPSISALPEHGADVRRAAEWTADALRQAGLQNVERIETAGHPLVYGEWLGAPGKPTILFYGHYDVQPVDPVDLWRPAVRAHGPRGKSARAARRTTRAVVHPRQGRGGAARRARSAAG